MNGSTAPWLLAAAVVFMVAGCWALVVLAAAGLCRAASWADDEEGL